MLKYKKPKLDNFMGVGNVHILQGHCLACLEERDTKSLDFVRKPYSKVHVLRKTTTRIEISSIASTPTQKHLYSNGRQKRKGETRPLETNQKR